MQSDLLDQPNFLCILFFSHSRMMLLVYKEDRGNISEKEEILKFTQYLINSTVGLHHFLVLKYHKLSIYKLFTHVSMDKHSCTMSIDLKLKFKNK